MLDDEIRGLASTGEFSILTAEGYAVPIDNIVKLVRAIQELDISHKPPRAITRDRANELLDYDPETGIFRWKRAHVLVKVGDVAGCLTRKGYVAISVDGREYYAHRLAWLICHGEFPVKQLDHKNRVKSDNRIDNLREATSSQNTAYAPKKTSGSGYRGVYWNKSRKRWHAKLRCNGKMIHIGYFDDPKEAYEAYKESAIFHFGEFAAQ